MRWTPSPAQLVWRFQTQKFAQDNDVGAGPTITPPGVNGFADGVVYVAGKDRIVYALNLRTGAEIWEFSIRDDSPAPVGGATPLDRCNPEQPRSTSATAMACMRSMR